MTRIDAPRPTPQTQAADARRDRGETNRDPFRDPRRDGRQDTFGARRDGLNRRDPGADGTTGQTKGRQAARDGSRDAVPGLDAAGSAFHRLVEERSRDDDRNDRHRSEPQGGGPEAERQVLAVAEPVPGMAAHGSTAAAEPPPVSSPQRPTGDAPPLEVNRMVALAERVDAALRLDRVAQACGEGTFRIVGEAACGLETVAVALTPHGLDVTLVHAFTSGRDDLCRAAAVLARELQDRFPTRRVRIIEDARSASAAASTSPDGLAVIGRLFARHPSS